MFFQVEPPAETLNYMIAGFVVIFGIMLIYVASLMARHRSLEQDAKALKDIETEE
jgi:hypothetical protein